MSVESALSLMIEFSLLIVSIIFGILTFSKND
ncbi:putative holin-like toxin [Candidatus Enterococcus murrayae]